MSKFIFDESNQRFDIEDALTINKGRWSDGNPNEEDRIGYFVTSANDVNEVAIADNTDYICGVTVRNDAFLGVGASYADCVVQTLGLCKVRFEEGTTFNVGDKVMPNENGIATKSITGLGYRVVGIEDDRLSIIIAPNNDMIHRVKVDIERINQTLKPDGSLSYDASVPTNIKTNGTLKFYRFGNVVSLTFIGNDYNEDFPVKTWSTLCTLPYHLRPRTEVSFMAIRPSSSEVKFKISTNGEVKMYRYSSTTMRDLEQTFTYVM